MLCNSGFVDDVMLTHNGSNGAESVRRRYFSSSSPHSGISRRPHQPHTGTKSAILICLVRFLVLFVIFSVVYSLAVK